MSGEREPDWESQLEDEEDTDEDPWDYRGMDMEDDPGADIR